MKSRFTTIDLCASVTELRERLLGMRVNNVYDIDNKTYLIRFQRPEEKSVLLIESGNRMHTTEFEWPKSSFPSGFAMKLRKHLKQRRLVAITQLGIDRIVDLQFGSNEAAYHLIVEFYDRGNIVLTDHEYVILNLLRRRIEKGADETKQDETEDKAATENKSANEKANNQDKNGIQKNQGKKGQDGKGKQKEGGANDDVQFSVGQIYPVELAKQRTPLITVENLKEVLVNCKHGELLKKALNPHFIYGHMLLEHCFIESGLPAGVTVGKNLDIDTDLSKVMSAITLADGYLDQAMSKTCKGYIIQKREKKLSVELTGSGDTNTDLLTFQEFHPFHLVQHKEHPVMEIPSFDKAVDEFFSKIGSQKLDVKALNQEKSALKKLDNVRKDHDKRIHHLQYAQAEDIRKAELVETNLPLVDQAILVVNSAIANQIDWSEIKNIVKEAQIQGDPVASAIRDLKLETNHMTMLLSDPFDASESDDSDEDDEDEGHKKKKKKKTKGPKGVKVDINLALSAYANARSYYVKKKHSAKKQQKTIDHSSQALKSAERKAKQTLKEVATTTSINKARKTYWFEKFLWFISSENYVVIGGRDQQQNELIVKRHLKPGDVYVHADLHGASSVIVKNKPGGHPVPPKTLHEAGSMAVCYSAAWDSKMVTSAWWVYHYQVSKTAPTGEYLTTGSFMIRGKKNFLPPTHLIMGFSLLFRVEETCIEHHVNERRVRGLEDTESIADSAADTEGDEELSIADIDSDEEDMKDAVTKTDQDAIDGQNKVASAGDDHESDDVIKKDDDVTPAVDDVTDPDEEDAVDSLFPDTSINLQIVSGKVKLQRGICNTSSQPEMDDHQIYLGGDHVINLKENKEKAFQVSQQRMAKQKKSQRGQNKQKPDEELEHGETEEPTNQPPRQEKKGAAVQQQQQQSQQQQTQQQQTKKGKKAKLKKMKEKYGDQDEEERRIRMEILASAGPAKESKADKRRAKKANKGSNASGKGKNMRQQQITPLAWEQNDATQNDEKGDKPAENTETTTGRAPVKTKGEVTNSSTECAEGVSGASREEAIMDNGTVVRDNTVAEGGPNEGVVETERGTAVLPEPREAWADGATSRQAVSNEQDSSSSRSRSESNKDAAGDQEDEDDDDDNPQDPGKENISILDALTGIPVAEDLMLFAVPVCAPYSAVQNYKFKVKLTPGANRKGKAAKSAITAFIHSKDASPREKDLLKSVKDADLARYFPGKVKVSAPNLQKLKRK